MASALQAGLAKRASLYRWSTRSWAERASAPGERVSRLPSPSHLGNRPPASFRSLRRRRFHAKTLSPAAFELATTPFPSLKGHGHERESEATPGPSNASAPLHPHRNQREHRLGHGSSDPGAENQRAANGLGRRQPVCPVFGHCDFHRRRPGTRTTSRPANGFASQSTRQGRRLRLTGSAQPRHAKRPGAQHQCLLKKFWARSPARLHPWPVFHRVMRAERPPWICAQVCVAPRGRPAT